MHSLRTILISLALAILIAGHAVADDVRKLSTEPRRSSSVGGARALARLDFNFGDIQAWLLQDGNWHIEGMVQHRGALCGEYQVGIQFGIGSPGCANVRWLGEPNYATYQMQCNSALVRHVGGDQNPEAATKFEQINCAQRLIRCQGNCK